MASSLRAFVSVYVIALAGYFGVVQWVLGFLVYVAGAAVLTWFQLWASTVLSYVATEWFPVVLIVMTLLGLGSWPENKLDCMFDGKVMQLKIKRTFMSRLAWRAIQSRVGQWIFGKLTEETSPRAFDPAPPMKGAVGYAHQPSIFYDTQSRMDEYKWWKLHIVVWRAFVVGILIVSLIIAICQHEFDLETPEIIETMTVECAGPLWVSVTQYLVFNGEVYGYYDRAMVCGGSILNTLFMYDVRVLVLRVIVILCLHTWAIRAGRGGRWDRRNNEIYGDLRSAFRKLHIMPNLPVDVHHSHPLSASSRNAGDTTATNFIRANGFTCYSLQLSSRDCKVGGRGALRLLDSVNMHSHARDDNILDSDIFKLVNCDYHLDWSKFLWMARPFIIYTFTPSDPCGSFENTRWTVDVDDYITMHVDGGAVYRHQLWDYNVDKIVARYPGKTIEYAVESISHNDCWSIILLTPAAHYWNGSVTSISLNRVKFVYPTTLMDGSSGTSAILATAGEPTISVSRPGMFTSVRVCGDLQTVLTARMLYDKIRPGDMPVLLYPFFKDKDLLVAQSMLYSSYPSLLPRVQSNRTVYNKKDLAIAYKKISVPQLVPDEKLSARVLCPPVLDSGFAPYKSKANEVWTVDARITRVANDQLALPPCYQQYSIEFSEFLFPIPHTLCPVPISQVVEKQVRPEQRRRNAIALPNLTVWFAKCLSEIRAFQKGEVYGDIKDPRNISTLPTEHCLLWSCFIMAVSTVMKTTLWYAFGMHPDKLARRVHDLAATGRTRVETDFSRFDGTHSVALYELELTLYLRAFNPVYHPMIRKLQFSMRRALARTMHGVAYELGGSRVTGAADTSVGNTLDNAFAAYSMYRKQGLKPRDAYDKLGLYGGDDGLSMDLDKRVAEKTAAELGLRLKATAVLAHEPCTMLGRRYYQPAGSPAHIADLPRQLSKIHIFANRDPNVTAEQVLWNRATSWLTTDSDTPVLGAWARMIKRLVAPQVLSDRFQSYLIQQWGANYTAGADHKASLELASRDLGVSVTDILDYELYLGTLTRLEDLKPLRATETKVVPGVMVGDTVHCSALGTPVVPAVITIAPKVKHLVAPESPKWGKSQVSTKAAGPKRESKGDQPCWSYQKTGICKYAKTGRKCAYMHIPVKPAVVALSVNRYGDASWVEGAPDQKRARPDGAGLGLTIDTKEAESPSDGVTVPSGPSPTYVPTSPPYSPVPYKFPESLRSLPEGKEMMDEL